MKERWTTVWTEFRLRFGLSAALLVAAGLLVGLERGPAQPALAVLVVLVTVAALQVDAFVGIVIGLVAAAAVVAVKRLVGPWGPEALPMVASEVATLLALAWVVGLLGDHLRTALRALGRPIPGSLVPAFDSLGLLGATPARLRLDEELVRRRRTGQPLGLLVLTVDVVDPALEDDAVGGACRAVARHVETLVRPTDVPFALSDRVLGAILPATDHADGWALLGSVVDSASKATFADRTSGRRRVVADCVTVRACLALADDETADAQSLLVVALDELEPGGETRARAS